MKFRLSTRVAFSRYVAWRMILSSCWRVLVTMRLPNFGRAVSVEIGMVMMSKIVVMSLR